MSKHLIHILTSFALILLSCSINNTTEYYYTITIKPGSHGTVCNAGDYQCRPQDALKIQVCSVENGYKFKVWKMDSTTSTSNCVISDRLNDTATISQIRGRVVIYPEFVQNAFTLNIVSDTLGKVSVPQIRNIVSGEKTKINATALPIDTIGYRFSHWVIITGSGEIFGDSIVMESDCSIKPIFERKNFSLIIVEASNGRIRDSIGGIMSGTYSFPFGYVVKLNAVADTGYQFSSWTGTSGSASTTVTINGTKNIGVNFVAIPAVSGVVYVWKGARGLNNGSNWANAYTDLSYALANAGTGKAFWLAAGLYRVADSSNAASSFVPQTGSQIYGGFTGFETTLSQRVWYSHPTILHGNSFQNYLIRLQSVSNIRLNGLTFERATSACVAVMSTANLDTIENCIFRDNVANVNSSFRALHVAGANTNVYGCVFYNNRGTSNDGHAITILASGTGAKIVNCMLANNNGPAIVNATSGSPQTELINCTIVNNTTTASAPGGVSVTQPALALRGCILWGNTSGRTTGIQIDSAAEISYCCIESGLSGTVGVLKRSPIWGNNTEGNPIFTTTSIPASISTWYGPIDATLPFAPTNGVILNSASFTVSRPVYDLRGGRRPTGANGFDLGAYETPYVGP